MKNISLAKVFKDTKTVIIKHGPVILTGLGIAGMVTTTVLAVKATPKALDLIEQKKVDELKDELTVKETVQTTWRCYIPAVALGTASVACLIGANSVNTRRTAALATAYKLSETAFAEYKEKVIETIGEKKEEVIKDKVAKAKLEKDPVHNHDVIVVGKDKALCYDGMFGRYFRSDIDSIKRAINKINRNIVVNNYVSLNEFYEELGLGPIDVGELVGWNLDDGEIEVEFSSHIAADGTPCLVIMYNVAPDYKYYKFA